MQREEQLTQWLVSLGPQIRDRIRIPEDLRSQLSADDVLQETYLSAFVAIESMPEQEPAVRAWLTRIARNLLIDAVRNLRASKRGGERRRLLAASRGESLFGQHVRTPSREVGKREVQAQLRSAIQDLPEPYRTAARSLLSSEPPAALAKRLGRTIGATHMLLSRTRALLGKHLSGEPADYFQSR